MAGLDLLQAYSSDNEGETEITNDENKASVNVDNNKKKLPLPQSILSWKGVVHHEEIIDDPKEHDGRLRTFKHERGNWATLVYINYVPNIDFLKWMNRLNMQLAGTGNFFEDFHVSLTRTLILKYHWIDSFVEAVKKIAGSHKRFTLEMNNLKIYTNEDKTRTFLGITVESPNNCLERLTQDLDNLMNDYQLPKFYEDASYHMSFLWCLGDQRKTLENRLSVLTSNFHDFLIENPELRCFQVERIQCKMGNKQYNLNLQ